MSDTSPAPLEISETDARLIRRCQHAATVGPTNVPPEGAERLAMGILAGQVIRAQAQDPTGATVMVMISSLKALLRFLRPVAAEVQLRYFRRWHRYARRLRDTRGLQYVVAHEPVFCPSGHPMGFLRVGVVTGRQIPMSSVVYRNAAGVEKRWHRLDDHERACPWCGELHVRPSETGWYMVDGEVR